MKNKENIEDYTSQDFLNEVCWNSSKQETIEEAADRYFPFAEKIGGETYTAYRGFIDGAKWQEQNSDKKYNIEDLKKVDDYAIEFVLWCDENVYEGDSYIKALEQFKKEKGYENI